MEWKNMDNKKNNTVFWVLIIGAGKGFSGKGRHFLKFKIFFTAVHVIYDNILHVFVW